MLVLSAQLAVAVSLLPARGQGAEKLPPEKLQQLVAPIAPIPTISWLRP